MTPAWSGDIISPDHLLSRRRISLQIPRDRQTDSIFCMRFAGMFKKNLGSSKQDVWYTETELHLHVVRTCIQSSVTIEYVCTSKRRLRTCFNTCTIPYCTGVLPDTNLCDYYKSGLVWSYVNRHGTKSTSKTFDHSWCSI